MMIDSLPALVSPALLFPEETLDQIPDLGDKIDFSCNENILNSHLELQHSLLNWMKDSGIGIEESVGRESGQIHWENTDERMRSLHGENLGKPCFNLFDVPYFQMDDTILKGLILAAVGIESRWFGIDQKLEEFTIRDRSILHCSVFPFSSAIQSLRVINEFCQRGTLFRKLDSLAKSMLEAENYDFVTLPIILQIQKFLNFSRNQILEKCLNSKLCLSWSIALNYIKPQFDVLESLDKFMTGFKLSGWKSESNRVLTELIKLAEPMKSEHHKFFESLYLKGFQSWISALEMWLSKGELPRNAKSFCVIVLEGTNAYGQEVYMVNKLYESSFLFSPHLESIKRLGEKVRFLKQLDDTRTDNRVELYSNFKNLQRNPYYKFNLDSPTKSKPNQVSDMKHDSVLFPSRHKQFMEAKRQELKSDIEKKIAKQREYANALDSNIADKELQSKMNASEEMANQKRLQKSEEKRIDIIVSLQKQMIQDHEKRVQILNSKEETLNQQLGIISNSLSFDRKFSPISKKQEIVNLEPKNQQVYETAKTESETSKDINPRMESKAIGNSCRTETGNIVTNSDEKNESRIYESALICESSRICEDEEEEELIQNFCKKVDNFQPETCNDYVLEKGGKDWGLSNFPAAFCQTFLRQIIDGCEKKLNLAFSSHLCKVDSRWRNLLRFYLNIHLFKDPFFMNPLPALCLKPSILRFIIQEELTKYSNNYLSLEDQNLVKGLQVSIGQEIPLGQEPCLNPIDSIVFDWKAVRETQLFLLPGMDQMFMNVFKLILKLKMLISKLKLLMKSSPKDERLRLYPLFCFFQAYESFLFHDVIGAISFSSPSHSPPSIKMLHESFKPIFIATFEQASMEAVKALMNEMIEFGWNLRVADFKRSYALFAKRLREPLQDINLLTRRLLDTLLLKIQFIGGNYSVSQSKNSSESSSSQEK